MLKDSTPGLLYRVHRVIYLLVKLMYPRCIGTALQLFATELIDTDTYLQADFRTKIRDNDGDLLTEYKYYYSSGIVVLICLLVGIPPCLYLIVMQLEADFQVQTGQQKKGSMGTKLGIW